MISYNVDKAVFKEFCLLISVYMKGKYILSLSHIFIAERVACQMFLVHFYSIFPYIGLSSDRVVGATSCFCQYIVMLSLDLTRENL